MTNILVGADPELFVFDKEANSFVSGHGMIPGTKENPHPVEGGAVQVDGMALEFNIEPASNKNQFVSRIVGVRKQLQEMIGDRYALVATPYVEFGEEYIAAQPEEARMLGCDPDWNAYTEALNEAPNAEMPFRTASGHIHVGWDEDQDTTHPDFLEACFMLARRMDLFLGIQSYRWSDIEKEMKRRDLYGKGGAFRPKSYGLEYRSLSNAWLRSQECIGFVYNQTVAAFNNLVKYPESHPKELCEGIVAHMNNPHIRNYPISFYARCINSTLENSKLWKDSDSKDIDMMNDYLEAQGLEKIAAHV